jgi:hypothetical protein
VAAEDMKAIENNIKNIREQYTLKKVKASASKNNGSS